MVTCTPTKRARIVRMHDKEHMSFQDIGREFKISKSSAHRNYTQMKLLDDPYHKSTNHNRKSLFSARDRRAAVQIIDSGKCHDGSDVQHALFPGIALRRVRKLLQQQGLNGRVRRKKPLLRPEHVEKRKLWAEDMADMTADDWRGVVFSDESKFNLFGSDGKQYCRRRPHEELEERNVKKTVKHGGGSVMVWGCITEFGPGRLHRVEGKMNARMYAQILEEDFLGTLRDKNLRLEDVVLQQDHDPKHKSKFVTNWLHYNDVKTLRWAPFSPDMNIIENAWDQLDDKIRARKPLPSNCEELWEALQEEWANLDMSYIDNLYDSLPRRVEALKEAQGKYTKY